LAARLIRKRESCQKQKKYTARWRGENPAKIFSQQLGGKVKGGDLGEGSGEVGGVISLKGGGGRNRDRR